MHIHGQHLLHQQGEHRGSLYHGAVAHHDGNEHHGDQGALNTTDAGLEHMGQVLGAYQHEHQHDGQHLCIGGGLQGGDAQLLEQQAQADDGGHAEIALPCRRQLGFVLVVLGVIGIGDEALALLLQAVGEHDEVDHDEHHREGGADQADAHAGHGGGAQIGGGCDVQGVGHTHQCAVGHGACTGGHGGQRHLTGHIQLFQHRQGNGQNGVLIGGHTGRHHQAGDDKQGHGDPFLAEHFNQVRRHGGAEAALHQAEAEGAADGIQQQELLEHGAYGGEEGCKNRGDAIRRAERHQQGAGKDRQKQVDALEAQIEEQGKGNHDDDQGNKGGSGHRSLISFLFKKQECRLLLKHMGKTTGPGRRVAGPPSVEPTRRCPEQHRLTA